MNEAAPARERERESGRETTRWGWDARFGQQRALVCVCRQRDVASLESTLWLTCATARGQRTVNTRARLRE